MVITYFDKLVGQQREQPGVSLVSDFGALVELTSVALRAVVELVECLFLDPKSELGPLAALDVSSLSGPNVEVGDFHLRKYPLDDGLEVRDG